MSELVPPSEIEHLVRMPRWLTQHVGMLAEDDEFLILHSQECVDTTPDLRTCPYSQVLDKRTAWLLCDWAELRGRPALIEIVEGEFLVPSFVLEPRYVPTFVRKNG